MVLKLVILDLDQTLIYSLKRFYKLFNRSLVEYGVKPVSWEKFIEYYRSDSLDKLIPSSVSPRVFWRSFRRKYSSEPVHSEDYVIPGARETLRYLKERGLKVVIATGREVDRDTLWRELEHFGLKEYIDEVYSIIHQNPEDEEIDFLKTGLLLRIIRDFNVKPCETVFVADYWVDMESCRRAGLICIAVKTGYESEGKLKRHGAILVIDSIRDLPKAIEEIERGGRYSACKR